jgi:hypothetical protein
MLFKVIVALGSENHKKLTLLWGGGGESEYLNIKASGTYTDQCALKGLVVFEMEACCTLSSRAV